MPARKLNFAAVRDIALALPGVEEGSIHGEPSLKLHGKLLACPALHKSAEPETLAVRLDFERREELLAAAPEVYYLTEHYVNYPVVLVRLSQVKRAELKRLLEMGWEFVGAKTQRKRFPAVRTLLLD